MIVSQDTLVKRQFGHRARLSLSPAGVRRADDQAHAARTMWNLLHAWWRMIPKETRTLANADAAIRQAREDIDFLAVLPAQAAQAVLKTYFRAWKNCWEGCADAPNFKELELTLSDNLKVVKSRLSGDFSYISSHKFKVTGFPADGSAKETIRLPRGAVRVSDRSKDLLRRGKSRTFKVKAKQTPVSGSATSTKTSFKVKGR